MTRSAYRHLTNSLPYYSHYRELHFLDLYPVSDSSLFSYFYAEREEKNKEKWICPDSSAVFPYYIFFKQICSLQAWFPVISVMLLLEDSFSV